jgi:Ca-activated chloride channel homolog
MIGSVQIGGLILMHPWWLIALLVIPAWLFVKRYRRKEEYPAVLASDLVLLEESSKSRKKNWPGIRRLLNIVTLVFVILAMTRPQVVVTNQKDQTEGIDIVLTMDISVSMLAKDFMPNRLESSKDIAASFIRDRGPDRIGLVVFSGQSFTLCPLTTDKAALITLLQQAQAGFIGDGSTAIGDGIATAINRLKGSNAVSKVIILLTDGENNAGNIDPLQAAEIAAMFGIRVYTIGVGSMGTAIGPVDIIGGNIMYGPVEVEIDEPTLRKAAGIAGGKYFRAVDEQALRNIYQEIDLLEKTKLDITAQHAKREWYPFLILTSLLLIIAGWLIQFLLIKSIP